MLITYIRERSASVSGRGGPLSGSLLIALDAAINERPYLLFILMRAVREDVAL